MSLTGIDEAIFASTDLATCRRFFLDWGLTLLAEDAQTLHFETLNGARLTVAHSDSPGLVPGVEPDPTLREVVWGVASLADLDALRPLLRDQPGHVETPDRIGCTDPAGLALRIQVSRKRDIDITCARSNSYAERTRIDTPSPIYDRATPVEIGHMVWFVTDIETTSAFYRTVLGFQLSDRYPGRGHFLRCAPQGGHHDLLLLQVPNRAAGLNHVAFTVRDLHEVFGGGMHMARCGWATELGPGKHPISSAIFWYFDSPTGGLIEYYSDADELTAAWAPRDFRPGPTVFAEWAIKGGLDGHTRRQIAVEAPKSGFITDRPKT